MSRKLPPLNSIKAFEAAAKLKSFTKAAVYLGVTQGAVSKQINLLEGYLGLILFERGHQSLTLTKAAKEYLASITIAFDMMQKATTEVMVKKYSNDKLHINILPSLSSHWLIPRLVGFRKKFPYILNIETGDGEVNFDKGIDIAFRATTVKQPSKILGKNWRKLHMEKLMDEELVSVCSPEFREKYQIEDVNDLARCVLLKHLWRPQMWNDFFKSLGLKRPNIKQDIAFEHLFMQIEAAKSGMGIALIPKFLIKEELENGTLIEPIKINFNSNYAYYIIHLKQKIGLQKIEDFKSWIKARL